MISVCLATYNGEKYIAQQLHSILSQLSPDDEVILSDDHSTDRTLAIAEETARQFKTPLRIFRNDSPLGYVANFERALQQAQGEYIFLSDQDDVWRPEKVTTCLQALQTSLVVAHDAQVVDGKLHELQASYQASRRPISTWWGTILRFSHLGCCMAFRREVLERALPFPSHRKFCTHDNWLFLVGQTFGKATVLRTPLIAYRRHHCNTSLGGKKANNSLAFQLSYRLYLIYHILLRICGCQPRYRKL